MLGIFGFWLQRVQKDTRATRVDSKQTRDNVVNDHTTNMRDENDSRHAETRRWFEEVSEKLAAVVRDVGGLRSDVGGLRSDIRNLNRADQGLDRRITGLEEIERSPKNS